LQRTTKLATAFAAAALAGAVIGLGVDELAGGGSTSPVGTTMASRPPAATAPAAVLRDGSRVEVRGVTLTLADSPAGRARERARVAVVLALRAGEAAATLPEEIVLRVDDREARPDRNAFPALGDLVRPVPAGTTATGELRFETAGLTTRALRKAGEATLVVGGRELRVEL
jgi:hypothetical protein